MQRLLEHGCPADGPKLPRSKVSRIPLSKAAGNGHYSVVDLLLRHGGNPNPFTYSLDELPMCKAISNGHFRIVQCLLDHGAYVNNKQMKLGGGGRAQ